MKRKWFESIKKVTAWVVLTQMLLAVFPVSVAYGATLQSSPSAHEAVVGYAGFLTPDNAYTNGAGQAHGEIDPSAQIYKNYNFSVPAGNQVSQVKVEVDAKTNQIVTLGSYFEVSLSWDGGTSWTGSKNCGLVTSAPAMYTCNVGDPLWSRTWAPSELSNSNFRVKVVAHVIETGSGASIDLDWVPVTVTHDVATTYTVDFQENGGTAVTDLTGLLAGALVAEPSSPTKTGYVFDGWYEDVALTNSWNFMVETVAGDMTLYAKWVANQYTITFDSAGGSYIAPITQDYSSAVTAPANPTRAGYTFNGWLPVVPTIMPLGGDYLVAQWSINQYTITFDSAGGSYIAPITQNYDTAVVAPANPTRTGYTFNGWLPEVPATMPAYDQTLVAQWVVNTYTITFDSAGGTPVDPISQDFGTVVTSPANPTRTGYSFNGWLPVIPPTMPAEDLTLVAQWVANPYTITFDSAGGTLIAPVTQGFGTAVTPPTDPTRDGFTFNGWLPVVPSTMPAENLTLVAQWITIPTIPIVLTPIVPAAPVVAAAPVAAVAGVTDEPEEVVAAEEEPVEEEKDVKGSSDKLCPWWWIIGLLYLAALAITGGVVKSEDQDSTIRRYWYVWPPLFGGIAWFAHYLLHNDFKATWFCNNYLLLAVLIAVAGEVVYSLLAKKSQNR
jgi:uncharacterized repeat protein (TIGR02543 family)